MCGRYELTSWDGLCVDDMSRRLGMDYVWTI